MASRTNLIYGISIFSALAVWMMALSPSAQQDSDVDLALILAMDCSYSVDPVEFDLQMQGLARAFSSPEVVDAIKQGPLGRIAVMAIQWSDERQQAIIVPWTIVSDRASARQVSRQVSAAPRAVNGVTSISAVIDFGIAQLAQKPFTADRQVIDISADGPNNSGRPTMMSRDRATAAGITINGLAIVNEIGLLDAYFRSYVAGGPASFVMMTNDYKAYGAAIKRKLLREIILMVS